MPPELEMLDQLLGGDLPLSVIRALFGDEKRFAQAVAAMLNAGELRLLTGDGEEVPGWQWREMLSTNAPGARLTITQAGARRIA
jgi:hypothetical protein